jgi:hypothetical protein
VSWTEPEFLAAAHAWIGRHVEPAGAPDQPHVQPWSTVIRVPTRDGDVWFKANAPGSLYEAGLVELLARRRPELVPPLLAADPERGWMLMADAGTRLRELLRTEADLAWWGEVLPRYAELQREVAADAGELLALGVPDARLSGLPERYERLARELGDERVLAAAERVAELCERLAAWGLPETIQHDDLHDAQVYVRDGVARILDWGDAVVSHPFFTLSVTLEGVIRWGLDDVEGSVDTAPFRDAYLAVWGDPAELHPACDAALRLGWAARAVNGWEAGGEAPAQTAARLRMFLDGRPG